MRFKRVAIEVLTDSVRKPYVLIEGTADEDGAVRDAPALDVKMWADEIAVTDSRDDTAKRLAAECDRYGLPHRLEALLRHLEGNRALTEATLRDTAEMYRAALLSVVSVCMDTDGNLLDPVGEIPVGEVLRMIAESGLAIEPLRESVAKSEWHEHAGD